MTFLEELLAFVGFDDGDRARLRELHGRLAPRFFSTKEGGTGLGMSIVHSLVSLHGGSIDLETGPGGTTFEVAIPRWR